MPNAYSDLCSTGFWLKLCTLGSYDRLSVILMAVSNAHCNHCFRGTKHKRFERTLIYHDTDTCRRLSVTLMIVLTPTMTTRHRQRLRTLVSFDRWPVILMAVSNAHSDPSFSGFCQRLCTMYAEVIRLRLSVILMVVSEIIRHSNGCVWDYPSF